jgi:4-hydroxyphenylacetate 3-monooxygenase
MNGAESIESMRDGWEVYIYREHIKVATTHPAFRNTERIIARLYDALHDPKRKDKLLLATNTGNGGFTHESCIPGSNTSSSRLSRQA